MSQAGKQAGPGRITYGLLAICPVKGKPLPGKPIDVRALLDDLFGEAKKAPKGYEDVIRQIVAKIPDIVKEHPNVGQLQIELPEAPGMLGGKRQLVIQVNQPGQQAQPA